MFKTSRVKNNQKIMEYLSKQICGIINIKANLDNDHETYEELVLKLRNYYEKFDYKEDKEKYLKGKLIVLESEKLGISNSDGIKEISIHATIMLAFISVFANFTKDSIGSNSEIRYMIFLYILAVIGFLIMFVYIIGKLDFSQNKSNRNKQIAINIHKSVIEEQLEEIEEKEKQNEIEKSKQEQIEKIIQELKENKKETSIVEKIINKFKVG
ncbi:hypothetical protein [Clostridium saccharoperbutylacetonicum]|uniref:hypothetical protein n=1 Tax=Clostridium saccharoperbutylacetonicum TaxID=36745 RepID=UPI0039EC2C69